MTKPQSIIILGAGLSGLAAAYELKKKGHQIILVEARNRPGGRIHTLRKPFMNGQYAEAGGIFLHTHQTQAMQYVQEFNIPLTEVAAGSTPSFYYLHGQKEKNLRPFDLLFKYITPVLSELGDVTESNWPPEALKKYDAVTFSQFLQRQGASDAEIQIMKLCYFDLWGDGMDAVSALSLLRDFSFVFKEKNTNYIIQGGNDQLPHAFAEQLKKNILYESPVEKIEHNLEGVRILYRDKMGKQQSVEANRAIITIPFSVLKGIEITPLLSVEKWDAIKNLSYTSVTRMYFQGSRHILENAGLRTAAYGDRPLLSYLRNVTYNQPGGEEGIVETYISGPRARTLDALSEKEQIQAVLEQMEQIIPEVAITYKKSAIYSWEKDPWAHGAYAWFKPGQMFSLLPYIARPEGRLHFAGEHTSPYPGWIEGALHSAKRVVKELS